MKGWCLTYKSSMTIAFYHLDPDVHKWILLVIGFVFMIAEWVRIGKKDDLECSSNKNPWKVDDRPRREWWTLGTPMMVCYKSTYAHA